MDTISGCKTSDKAFLEATLNEQPLHALIRFFKKRERRREVSLYFNDEVREVREREKSFFFGSKKRHAAFRFSVGGGCTVVHRAGFVEWGERW